LKISRRNTTSAPLSFTLYQRCVHPELFTIYDELKFEFKRASVLVWITRHCHVVTISVDGVEITELIAAPGQPLPAGGLLAKFQLSGEKKHAHTFDNGIGYRCKFDTVKTSRMKKHYRELKKDTNKNSRLISLEELSTGGESGFSFINCSCGDNVIMIRTKHSRRGNEEMTTTCTTINLSNLY